VASRAAAVVFSFSHAGAIGACDRLAADRSAARQMSNRF